MERRRNAIELRKVGLSYAEIGARLGVSAPAAHAMVKKELTLLQEKMSEETESLRAMELARLDVMQKAIWLPARNGNFGAIDRILRIMERRAALVGLDAPTKVAATQADGTDIDPMETAREFDAILEQLAERYIASVATESHDAGAVEGGDPGAASSAPQGADTPGHVSRAPQPPQV